jgi:hypothetical protein
MGASKRRDFAHDGGARAKFTMPRSKVIRSTYYYNSGQYDKIGGLFSDGAVYMGPDGKTYHGGEEIGTIYKRC